MNFARAFLNLNIRLSKWFDQTFLPPSLLKDGNRDFVVDFGQKYLASDQKIYDVGGGKQPFIDARRKAALRLNVVGIDISEQELSRAPVGAYDKTVCADIARHTGTGDGDIVICQAVLEHVRDTEGAIQSIASLLKPGGKALIFVPSRNAAFARLNLLLPQKVKQWILFAVYPTTRTAQGFPSFYARCTPAGMMALAKANNLRLEDARYYYISSYFSFFFPLYLFWRVWIVCFKLVAGHQAAETFSMALVKMPDTKSSDADPSGLKATGN